MSAGAISRILAKDLRRFWPLVGCAAGLTALSTGLAFYPASTLLSGDNLETAPMILYWFIVVFIAMAAAQDDPPDGDRGGWLARPVSGLQVLTAKIILLAGTLALPAALTGAWAALALEGRPTAIVAAAGSLGGLTFLVALAAALLGALTGSLLRAVFVAVGLGVAYSFSKIHWDALGAMLRPASPAFGQFPPTISAYRQNLILMASELAGTLTVLCHQYMTRRTRRSVALGAALGLLVWLSGQGWPWIALGRSPFREHPQSIPPPVALSLADSHAYLEQNQSLPFPQEDRVVIGVQVHKTGQAGGREIFTSQGQSRFTVAPDHSITMRRFDSLMAWNSSADQSDSEAPPYNEFEVLESRPIPRPASTFTSGLLTIPRSTYDAFRGSHGKLESWIQFYSAQLRVAARTPLAAGARVALPGQLWRIHSLFQFPNGSVHVAIDSVNLRARPPFDADYSTFILVNAEKNEFASESEISNGYFSQRSALVVQSQDELYSYQSTWNLSTHQKTSGVDEDWLKHAELVVLKWDERPMGLAYFDWGEIELPASPARH